MIYSLEACFMSPKMIRRPQHQHHNILLGSEVFSRRKRRNILYRLVKDLYSVIISYLFYHAGLGVNNVIYDFVFWIVRNLELKTRSSINFACMWPYFTQFYTWNDHNSNFASCKYHMLSVYDAEFHETCMRIIVLINLLFFGYVEV